MNNCISESIKCIRLLLFHTTSGKNRVFLIVDTKSVQGNQIIIPPVSKGSYHAWVLADAQKQKLKISNLGNASISVTLPGKAMKAVFPVIVLERNAGK